MPNTHEAPVAIRGGTPAFPERLPLSRPSVPDPEAVGRDVVRILRSGVLTDGSYVRRLEEQAAAYLGVRHCVAVASCTAGLMLVLRASELSGDVILPSFTFAATAHAVAWTGLRPVFADIDPTTLTLSPECAARAVGVRTSAILATHVFGTPCDVESLENISRSTGIRLFFDAAHAFGSRRVGRLVGAFGDAEVFSLSPTKVVVAGEGGLIATDDDVLAARCRIGLNYGNPGDYDCIFLGLNARMSELHAATALVSMKGIDDRIEQRNILASAYKAALEQIPGLTLPVVSRGDTSTYKDFTIMVDPDRFALDAAALGRALTAEGIETRHYYSPPVHRMRVYRSLGLSNVRVPHTEAASRSVLTLPLWQGMSETHVARVAEAIARIQRSFEERNGTNLLGELRSASEIR
jgi:dTDP-4-amino-4,6-dideoxygalactose transaminase